MSIFYEIEFAKYILPYHFTLSWNMDGMKFGHRIVLTHICGNRRIHAYVSCTASGSRRLFFSTLDPSTLHMSYAWQE